MIIRSNVVCGERRLLRGFARVTLLASLLAVAANTAPAAPPALTSASTVSPGGSTRVPLVFEGPVSIEFLEANNASLPVELNFNQSISAFRRVEVEGATFQGATIVGDNSLRVELSGVEEGAKILIRVIDVAGPNAKDDGVATHEVRFAVFAADVTGDGVRSAADAERFKQLLGGPGASADINNDGKENMLDAQRFIELVRAQPQQLANSAPWINVPKMAYGIPGQKSELIPLEIRDDLTPLNALNVQAFTGNESVVNNSSIEVEFSGGQWYLSFLGTQGQGNIIIEVTDAANAKSTALLPISVEQPTPPEAVLLTRTYLGLAPLRVVFDARESVDAQNNIIRYDLDLGNGASRSGALNTYTYNTPGQYKAVLTLTDSTGLTATAERVITVASAYNINQPVSEAEARRFLWQAAWGPGPDDVAYVMANGFEAWIDQQKTRTPNYLLKAHTDLGESLSIPRNPEDLWSGITIAGNDQLRQRIAWTLAQIFPIRGNGNDHVLYNIYIRNSLPDAAEGSTGNYREMLYEITFSDYMGDWLTYNGNKKEDPIAGTAPDENYGREIMQLFTLGLWELNTDGTFKRDVFGERIPTYEEDEIYQISKVFTGLRRGGSNNNNIMQWRTSDHDFGEVILFNYPNAVPLNGILTASSASVPEAENNINGALDNLFYHPTFAPFIAEQLIKRMTTSNPTPAYIERVAQAFAGNGPYGTGVRGDMFSVHKALLLDDEARNPAYRTNPFYGKLLEPLVVKQGSHRLFRNVDRPEQIPSLQKGSGFRGTYFGIFGQAFLYSPSVFNFYKPEFAPLNTEISRAGFVAPEAEIVNDNTAITAPNSYDDVSRPDRMHPSIGNELLALSTNPQALVDRVEMMVNFGSTHPDVKAIIVDAVSRINNSNAATQADRRVRCAVSLCLLNPGFRHLR